MKGIKEFLLDDSPKNVKKLEKMLAKDPQSASYFEAAKSEARSANAVEFQNIRILVTDSYLCYHDLGIGAGFVIIPISTITNIYRTNIISTEYDYDNFTLAVEIGNGIRYLTRFPRTGKSIDIYNDAIAAVKARMAVNGGAQV